MLLLLLCWFLCSSHSNSLALDLDLVCHHLCVCWTVCLSRSVYSFMNFAAKCSRQRQRGTTICIAAQVKWCSIFAEWNECMDSQIESVKVWTYNLNLISHLSFHCQFIAECCCCCRLIYNVCTCCESRWMGHIRFERDANERDKERNKTDTMTQTKQWSKMLCRVRTRKVHNGKTYLKFLTAE